MPNTDMTPANTSIHNFEHTMAEAGEIPVISNTLTFDDLFVGSPELQPMDEDAFREEEPLDMLPLADLKETQAAPIRQDTRPQLVSDALVHKHDPRLRPLQGALKLGTQKGSTSTTCVNPSVLQQFGTGANRPDPFALPKLGRSLVPRSRDYGMVPLPSLPPFSVLPPPVPPKSVYDTAFTFKPPPVPPKDNFNGLTYGALRSANSLRSHLIHSPFQQQAARYPHQPLHSMVVYDQVEDLALDPQERLNHCARASFTEVRNHALRPIETSSRSPTPMEVSSEDVDMDSSPPQGSARSNRHSDRYHCECHESTAPASANANSAESRRQLANQRYREKIQAQKRTVKGPVTIVLAKSRDKLATAALTAKANAGGSGYAPRKQGLTTTVLQNGKQRAQPFKGPVKIVSHYSKTAQARDRAAEAYSSSDQDTDSAA